MRRLLFIVLLVLFGCGAPTTKEVVVYSETTNTVYSEVTSTITNTVYSTITNTVYTTETHTIYSTITNTVYIPVGGPMPDTGWVSFTTASDGGGSYPWSNPSNALVSDNNNATIVPSAGGQWTNALLLTTPGIAIPSGALLKGIEVSIECSTFISSVWLAEAKLLVSGSPVGNDQAGFRNFSFPFGGEGTLVVGSPTNLWGASITPSSIATSGFGVQLKLETTFSSADARIDYVKIKVYYDTLVVAGTGHGTDSVSTAIVVSISDFSYSFEALDANGVKIIYDLGHGAERLNGEPEASDWAFALDRIVLEKHIVVEDGCVSSEAAIQQTLQALVENINYLEEILLTNIVTQADSGRGTDVSDVDYNFSSVVIRFSGKSAAVKFTGYREEIS